MVSQVVHGTKLNCMGVWITAPVMKVPVMVHIRRHDGEALTGDAKKYEAYVGWTYTTWRHSVCEDGVSKVEESATWFESRHTRS